MPLKLFCSNVFLGRSSSWVVFHGKIFLRNDTFCDDESWDWGILFVFSTTSQRQEKYQDFILFHHLEFQSYQVAETIFGAWGELTKFVIHIFFAFKPDS